MKSTFIQKTVGLAMGAVLTLSAFASAQTVVLNGAGATFPYPIYSKWFNEYHNTHPDVEINYQSIGSGGGIKQITAHTVDFGASDGPMNDQQMAQVGAPLMHIPTVLGGVVPIFNVDGVTDLKLSGPVLANIFLGKITQWNDPAIVALNPDAKLPAAAITVAHRSDGSGTSYCFTDFLSKVSPDWKQKVGKGTAVNWPAGLGGKGNEGVSGLVKQTPNSIGYVELIYALQNNISYAAVQNKAGKFIKADLASVSAAAESAAKNMPKDYRVSITNADGDNAYPISTFTWLLVYKRNLEGRGVILRDFLTWMLQNGEGMVAELGYAPLPDSVRAMEKKTIESIR